MKSWDDASEDCLYINLYTPAKTTADHLPVMVWFHGGGLFVGSANEVSFNDSLALPQKDVVMVLVNQRLGALGYLAHPLLSQESEHGVSGNYGTLDQIAALQWVQKNITAFGGDPNRVTVFGQSGGGAKVTALLCSPLAKGLFQRAIIISGFFQKNRGQSLEEAQAAGEELAAKLGIDGEADVLSAMRSTSWQEIAKVTGSSALTVDGWVLPDQPANIFQAGKQNDVPLIIGACANENTSFEDISFAASSWDNVKSDAYVYVFSQVPANWKDEGAVAVHGVDVYYVFGYLDYLKTFVRYGWPVGVGLGRLPGYPKSIIPKNPDPGITEADHRVSDNEMSMWVQFAATGNPNVPGLPTWPAYDTANPQGMDIADPLQVKLWSLDVFFNSYPTD